jgi:hypothetical protein
LARKTMYKSKDSGGLNIVNIEYKLYALRLKHIQDIIVNKNVKFINFSRTLPIYHIFDVAKTLTTRDFSNKDKCLNFHRFNTFSNFT